jgi:pimeloyl-ACP methyl ester carboxylesterase
MNVDGYRFAGRDGVELAYRETGSGRPLILLLRGFGGAGSLDAWADVFVEPGRRVVLPDFRGHGDSAKPHDPAAYPPDILADDGFALVECLGFGDGDYDLGGYSLGARIVLRMLVRGAKPGRAIVAGQGLAKVSGPQGNATRRVLATLVDGVAVEPGSRDALMAQWISKVGADPQALLHVLDSLVPTREDALAQITIRRLSRSAIGMSDRMQTSWPRSCAMPNSYACRGVTIMRLPRLSWLRRWPHSSPNAEGAPTTRAPISNDRICRSPRSC